MIYSASLQTWIRNARFGSLAALVLLSQVANAGEVPSQCLREWAVKADCCFTRLALARLDYDVDERTLPGLSVAEDQDLSEPPFTCAISELDVVDFGLANHDPQKIGMPLLSCRADFRPSQMRAEQEVSTAPIRIGWIVTDLQTGRSTMRKSSPIVRSIGMAEASIVTGETLPPGRYAVTAVVLWQGPQGGRLHLLDHQYRVLQIPRDAAGRLAIQ